MIKFLDKFNYLYLFIYIEIFYYFFTTLSIKENFSRINILFNSTDNLLSNYDNLYREKKIFIDLKYKKEILNFNGSVKDIILIDKEYKVVGYKSNSYKKDISTGFTFYLGRKLLHSSLFGSIKLIKL